MAHKNMCSGCGFNFASVGTLDKHRVGTVGKDRRCLTVDEMKAKGWELSEPLLTLHREGVPYQERVSTWSMPFDEPIRNTIRKHRERGNSVS